MATKIEGDQIHKISFFNMGRPFPLIKALTLRGETEIGVAQKK